MKKSERIKVLEERIEVLEQQERVRERNFNNLTADEQHILNKFFSSISEQKKNPEFLKFLKDEQTKLCPTNSYKSQHLLQRIINKYTE
jgi:hypothetical protein